MALDTIDRKVIYEVLCTNLGYANLQTVLYRLANTYRDGLTEKERAFILHRIEVLKEEMAQVEKLRTRLQGTLNGRR